MTIAYDPESPEIITVSYPDIPSFEAHLLEIKEYCGKSPAIPVSMQPVEPATSRLLDALEKKCAERQEHVADALSFANYGKEDQSPV